MIDKRFVEAKLAYIQSYYQELENVLDYPDKEIKEDKIKLRALERIIQLIVDEMIDINNHFIRYAHLRVPEDFQSAFLVLAENNILPQEFAIKLAPVVGLRNRLVHRYEKVDVGTLLISTRKSKSDFKEYVRHILKYLS
ncbi:MAG: type VII toxin-antitoxin system HepT family RNase toxin [Thermodesulfobacteriota bacterium]